VSFQLSSPVAVGIIIGCAVLFFWQPIFLNKTFFEEDIITLNYPGRFHIASLIKRGHFPLWCTHIFCGFPIFAESQMGVLYPGNALFLFLPGYLALNYTIILHYLIAGLNMYFYMRATGNQRGGSLVSALVFMFSGFLVAQLIHINIIQSIAWLPLIVACIEKYFQTQKKIYSLYAGILLSFQFLAGYFYIVLLTLLVILGRFLQQAFIAVGAGFKTALTWRKKRSVYPLWVHLLKLLSVFCLIIIIGIGLSAIQLIPTYELSQHSVRSGGVSGEFSTQVSFSPLHLITLIFPHFLGNEADKTAWGPWWGNYIDLTAYCGILPLMLAVLAVLLNKSPQTRFWGITGLLALLCAFGEYSPLWWLLNLFPVFNMMRYPSRFLFIYTFAIATLAGIGYNSLIDVKNSKHRRRLALFNKLALIVIAALTFFIGMFRLILVYRKDYLFRVGEFVVKKFIYKKSVHWLSMDWYHGKLERAYQGMLKVIDFRHPYIYIPFIFCLLSLLLLFFYEKKKLNTKGTTRLAFFLLILFDLFIFGINYNKLTVPGVYTWQSERVKYLRSQEEIFRYAEYPMWNDVYHTVPLIWELSHINGWSPLQLKRHRDLINSKTPIKLLDLFNVRYIISNRKISGSGLELVSEEDSMYENKNALPRAYVVHSFEVATNESQALEKVKSASFDYPRSVILERLPHEKLPVLPSSPDKTSVPTRGSPPTRSGHYNVRIVRYHPNQVEIETQTEQAGFLVLSDTYYPGWRAFVDGQPNEIYRANYLFRAIYLPSGRHKVEFKYEPLSFQIGAVITLLTLIASVCYVVWNYRKRSVNQVVSDNTS